MGLLFWRKKPQEQSDVHHASTVYVNHEGVYIRWVTRVFFTDTISKTAGAFNELVHNLHGIPEVQEVRVYPHYVAIEWQEENPEGDIDPILADKAKEILAVLSDFFATLPHEVREQLPILDRDVELLAEVNDVHDHDDQGLWRLGAQQLNTPR